MSVSSIPVGRAKILTSDQCIQLEENIQMYDHYIVDVELDIEGYQQIPMLCKLNEDGTRDWTNTPSKITTMTKIDLINLSKYYTINDYKIVQGIYWNEGVNNRVQQVIKDVFEARAKAKREKNEGLQQMLKLFMNSAYGKCNVKASKSDVRYVRADKLNNFVKNNYEFIKSMTCLDEDKKQARYRVKLTKHTYVHSNLAHVAGVYLSNSKVIVNDVLQVFTVLGKEVLYTDTDSLHVYQEDIPEVAQKYRELYNRELIGKGLGQFHDDFAPIIPKISQGVKIPKNERKAYPQYSVGFISLGKKVYLDVLANDFTDDVGAHIRFKGANEANIEHYCEKNNKTLVDFYTDLYNGESVKLDLCAGKTRFDYDEKGRVYTKESFFRKFSF